MMAPFQRRSLAACILLSIFTCGIYGIYWFYVTARDLYSYYTPNRVDMSPGLVTLLSWLCGYYGVYVFYKWGKQVSEVAADYGRRVEDRSVLYLLLALFFGIGPIINLALIQNDFNNLLDGTLPPAYGQPPPDYQYPGAPPPPPPPPPSGSPYGG